MKHFLSARADDNIRDLVHENNKNAARVIAADRDLTQVPCYAWPTAGFIMARLQTGLVEISGPGDCVALIEMSDGYVERFCALPDSGVFECEAAGILRAAKDRGLSSILTEIRRIERFVDRECRQFPRYKRSDDSSAILLEISKSDDNSRQAVNQ